MAKKFGLCKSMSDYDLRYDEDGLPIIEDCQKTNFAKYYTSVEAISLFRSLYTNKLDMQDNFVNYWANLTDGLKGNEYIVGYDPLNEPLPVGNNILSWIKTVLFDQFDNNELAPFLARIYETFQQADEDNIMYFEATPMLPDAISHLKFTVPPGGELGSKNHVLNDHVYCCSAMSDICTFNEDPSWEKVFAWKQFCKVWTNTHLSARSKDADRLGVPLIMSEFGACTDLEPCVTEVT